MKRFITVRLWEETREKLEIIRIEKSRKERRMISLAELVDEMCDKELKNISERPTIKSQ